MGGSMDDALVEAGSMPTHDEFKARREERLEDFNRMQALILDTATPGLVKQRLRSEYAMRWRRTLFSCPRCWLMPHLCVCQQIVPSSTSHCKVIISAHPSEWGRATNSGCVALLTLPGDSQMLLRGLPAHDELLQEVLDDPTHTVAVLYPGEQSVTAQELQAVAREKTNGRIAIIALDATWGGARRLRLGLPREVLQVKLSAESCLPERGERSLLHVVREYKGKQEENGRVSTLEATAALLRELGEGEELYALLIANLKRKVAAMKLQKYHLTRMEQEQGKLHEELGLADAA